MCLPVPRNVRLHVLPPCTPELPPVEPYWGLVRETAANDTFDRLADLRRVVRRRCRWLAAGRPTVPGALGFHGAVRLEASGFNETRHSNKAGGRGNPPGISAFSRTILRRQFSLPGPTFPVSSDKG